MTIERLAEDEVLTRVGSVLARKYRIERVLGVGGMGAVYAAVHRNGARVAIKVLHRAFAAREDVLRRFVREGSLANRIAHPGVVRILDDDVAADGSVFLVMELLPGATIRDVADRSGGRMDTRDALVVGHRVLHVLDAAHREGVIHRDIKPNNVFLTTSGEIKLLDFGIARLREGDGAADGTTRTGMTLGTPGFMSPEQVLGHHAKVDARSDVWSVGAMLFNLLTGRSVHEGATAQEVVVFTATRPARSVRDLCEVPEPVAALVDRALALAPEDRWSSAAEMLAASAQAYEDAFCASVEERRIEAPPSARVSLAFAPTAAADPGATLDPSASRLRLPLGDESGTTTFPGPVETPRVTPDESRIRPRTRGVFALVAAPLVIAAIAVTFVRLRGSEAPMPIASASRVEPISVAAMSDGGEAGDASEGAPVAAPTSPVSESPIPTTTRGTIPAGMGRAALPSRAPSRARSSGAPTSIHPSAPVAKPPVTRPSEQEPRATSTGETLHDLDFR